MKTQLLTVGAALLASTLAAAPPSAPIPAAAPASGEAKIAYVDTSEVVMRSLEFKEYDRQAQSKIDLKDEEVQKKREELRKLREELAALSAEKQKELQPQYYRKLQEYDDFLSESRDEITSRSSVELKNIAQKVQRIIETIGREMELALVIDAKAVLYADKSKMTNLTDKVVDILNTEYEKEKEKMRVKVPDRVK